MSNNKTLKLSPVKGSKGSVTCSVVLLDGETLEVPIDKNDIGRALFDRVCEHLDLVEKDFFGFTYTDDRGPSNIKYWLNLDKKISKVKKQGGAWVFEFALKFYPPDPAQLRESLTRWLVVLQIRRDLLSGRIPCTLTTYALLGSYNVQADVGEYDADRGTLDYIKNMTFAPNQTPDLLEKITELHKQHKGQTPDEAERAFLDNAKKLAMYGVDLHKARDADNNAVMLGVCCSGLLIYREKLRINRFVWPKILKLSYKRNYFNIKVRPGELERGEATIAFKLDNHKLAKRLWKTCVEHHAFFRLRESDTPANNPTFPRFGSKFRYSGRTLYQSRNATALLDRPPPFFERSNSTNRNSYEDSGNRSQSMDELGRSKRLMSTDSRDSSLYGGDTLNRTREYNLDDPSKNVDMDEMGNTLQRRPNPYDSLDRRDRIPGRGDATENYDGGKDFMALNGDKPMFRSDLDEPCKYRYNKNGQEYPLAYPCDIHGKEYPFDKDGNKFLVSGGQRPSNGVLSQAEDPKKYRFDKHGKEFPYAFPSDINGKDYDYDKSGNRYPHGNNGLSHRFDRDGNEYPYGYAHDREGREYPYDNDGNVYPQVGGENFGYDNDGKRFRFDKDGNEYLQGFPFDKNGKEYPYDQDGNRFPYGGDGQGYVFDSKGKEYPLAFPYDNRRTEYSYDKDGNKCPTEGFRFDNYGNEYPLAYPCDSEGKKYAYDKNGIRYPQDPSGNDEPGYVYGKDGNDFRFDKDGKEFPGGFPCDPEGKEYPYTKYGVKCPPSLATSSPVNAYRYDQSGNEFPLAYPCDSSGKEYAYDKFGNKYPRGPDGRDLSGYVYGKDGNKFRFDERGQEFPGSFPCDQQGKEYPYNKVGVRCPTSVADSIPAGVYRFDKNGYEYPLAYPCDTNGKEFSYNRDGQRYPQGSDGRDLPGYVYGRDGEEFKFDKDGNEYPCVYPCDHQGQEYPYNKDGLRCPSDLAYRENLKYSPGVIAPVYNVDGQKYRYDQLGSQFPFGYPHDLEGYDYPYDQEGNRCPYEGYRFDSSGKEFPLGYPIDKDGNAYCYDRDGNRFPQTKDGADRTGYMYDKDGKRYRFDKNGMEYPYACPFDRAGKEYCYDRDGKKYHDPLQDQVQQNGYGDTPDRFDEKFGTGDVTTGLPYGADLGMGVSDTTGVVGVERQLEHSEWFEPLPKPIKETRDSLKNTMPFFSPAATSTVGRNKGPPPPIPAKPSQSAEDSFNYKTERDGVEEAHVVQKVTITGDGGDDDFDFDAALADAIRSVTEFNPDMSVERIECVQQIEDVKDGN